MSTVYVVNRSCHNFNKATAYGDIKFMTVGSIDKFNLTKMHRTFFKYLKDSDKQDYIVISGLTNMSVIACGIFVNKHHRLNLLLWNQKKKTYKAEMIFFEDYSFELDKDNKINPVYCTELCYNCKYREYTKCTKQKKDITFNEYCPMWQINKNI